MQRWITRQLLSYILMTSIVQATHTHEHINLYTKKEQALLLAKASLECEDSIRKALKQPTKDNTTLSCPIDFDSAVCWPQTPADQTAEVQCPAYVNMFDSSERAYRYCTPSGTWSTDNKTGLPIVNYNRCSARAAEFDPDSEEAIPSLVEEHLAPLRLIYLIGHAISVFSLIVAMAVMLVVLRRLHCPRNMIHMNMFVSFILRGGIQLLREYIVVNNETPIGKLFSDNSHTVAEIVEEEIIATQDWRCKMLATLWMYTRLSNYTWIFVEGVYLHTLIFVNTFSDRSGVKWFILVGWGSPLLFVIPWMLVRIYLDNVECWMIYHNRDYRWILEAPIVALIIVNFIFFLIIIRLLFTKLRASESTSREARVYRYMKLAKSTLILIPLFGVHYMVFLFAEFSEKYERTGTLMVARFYFDAIVSPLQGLSVSILFCFMNGEVKAEIQKKWKRWQMLRNMNAPTTTTVSNQLTNTQRTSIGSDMDSLTANRISSRNASIQSSKSSTAAPISKGEEMHVLLSIDDNQNEFDLNER